MKLTDFSVDRSITVVVSLVLVLVFGLWCAYNVPLETEPEIIVPMAMVTTRYEGVAPQDMETLVTMPIERKLTGISGVKKITSTTGEGMSTVVVEFNTGVDVDQAIQKVRDKVDTARPELPEEADDPVVLDINTAESPIMQVNLTGPIDRVELTQIAERMQDELEALPGVLGVDLIGGYEREIQIIVDPARAAGYGVSLAELAQIAFQENVNVPAGSMEMGQGKYSMRVPGEIHGADDLRDLVVKRGETGVVYLRDVAEITDGFKDPENYARLDFEPSITLVIKKRVGANVVELSNTVRRMLDGAKTQLPPDVRVDVTLDESRRISDMFSQLMNSGVTGLIMVLISIWIFLGLWNSILISLAIPVTMFMTFMVMYATGISFNMVTLFSLMVAIGMVVDNGTVVVENIDRYVQEGYSKAEAAKKGAAEVAWPVIGSTATASAAFFPLIFWPGMMGSFMSLLPKIVIIAMLASLVMALVINPALAARYGRGRSKKAAAGPAKESRFMKRYGEFLELTLRWRFVTLAAMVILILTITGIYLPHAQIEFLNEVEPDRAHVNIELEEGANLDATDAVAKHIEKAVTADQGFTDFITTSVGSHGASVREGMPGANQFTSSSHLGRVSLAFPEESDRKVKPSAVVNELRHSFTDVPGAEIRITESQMGPPQATPVNIELRGEDFGVLAEIAEQVKAKITDVNGLVDLHDDLERGKPEVRVVVDRQQAKLAGLNTQYIGAAVQAAVHGRKAGEFRVGDDEYDVTVKFPEWFRKDVSFVEGMSLVNAVGAPIPFASVAKLEYGNGPGTIKRIDRKRTMTVLAEAEGRPGPEVLADVQERLKDLQLPPGYTLAYTGERQEINETVTFMGQAFVVALLLIAVLLILQFNSILQSLIIMSSVILSLGGVFLGLLVFDMPFGVLMTGIACISLAGVVVNNGIILVDFTNVLRNEGMPSHEAIITASKLRLRPVLITAGTTVVGLIPLAFGLNFDFENFTWTSGGSQGDYWKAMAVGLIFGLTFATMLTLVITPVLYSLMESIGGKTKPAVAPHAPVPAATATEAIAK